MKPREVVQQSGDPRFTRIGAVPLREKLGGACDAHDVPVTVVLVEDGANVARELCVRQNGYASSVRSAVSRARYKSPFKLPAHMTSAFSLLSL